MRFSVQQQLLGEFLICIRGFSLNRMLPSGVMRITVSVVVIMFEVTGALTYVLPLMVCAFAFTF